MSLPPPREETRLDLAPSMAGAESYVHATAIVVKEAGVLITGPSGAGKSRLALTLIAMAENAGCFARLIGDDRISLERCGGRLIARGHPRILGQIERRGQGVLKTPCLAAAVIRLAIDLAPADALLPRHPEPGRDRISIASVNLPLLRAGRDSAAADLALTVLQLFNSRTKSA